MIDFEKAYGRLPECQNILDLVYAQRETLQKEVQKYCAERGT